MRRRAMPATPRKSPPRCAAPDRPLRLVDLGAGTGGNFRVLAPVIAAPQDWLLVDNDAMLLAAEPDATSRWRHRTGAPERWRAETRPLDLADQLDALDLAAFDGITAAALLDLVSADWLARLVQRLAAAAKPFLAALSVDGRLAWAPSHPEDAVVASGFARDQHRDKGFGAALGPAAAPILTGTLERHGFAVAERTSDWEIGPADPAMLVALVTGTAAAARQAAPHQEPGIAAWEAARLAAIAAGTLSLRVGHRDVLALPRGGSFGTSPIMAV